MVGITPNSVSASGSSRPWVTLSELEAANRCVSDVARDTVIVVRSSDGAADLRCGGAPLVTLEASRSGTSPASD